MLEKIKKEIINFAKDYLDVTVYDDQNKFWENFSEEIEKFVNRGKERDSIHICWRDYTTIAKITIHGYNEKSRIGIIINAKKEYVTYSYEFYVIK